MGPGSRRPGPGGRSGPALPGQVALSGRRLGHRPAGACQGLAVRCVPGRPAPGLGWRSAGRGRLARPGGLCPGSTAVLLVAGRSPLAPAGLDRRRGLGAAGRGGLVPWADHRLCGRGPAGGPGGDGHGTAHLVRGQRRRAGGLGGHGPGGRAGLAGGGASAGRAQLFRSRRRREQRGLAGPARASRVGDGLRRDAHRSDPGPQAGLHRGHVGPGLRWLEDRPQPGPLHRQHADGPDHPGASQPGQPGLAPGDRVASVAADVHCLAWRRVGCGSVLPPSSGSWPPGPGGGTGASGRGVGELRARLESSALLAVGQRGGAGLLSAGLASALVGAAPRGGAAVLLVARAGLVGLRRRPSGGGLCRRRLAPERGGRPVTVLHRLSGQLGRRGPARGPQLVHRSRALLVVLAWGRAALQGQVVCSRRAAVAVQAGL